MTLFKFIFNHRSWRISKASKFGKIEHTAGRYIAIPIIIGGIIGYINTNWLETINFILAFFIWITYLSAHTLEKKLYGHFGPRG